MVALHLKGRTVPRHLLHLPCETARRLKKDKKIHFFEDTKKEKQQEGLSDSTHKELKVLLINGSPRKEGNTYLALMEAAKELEKNGIATELLQIGTQALHGCTACNHCKKTNRCVFDDDLCNRAIDLMAECDAIIVGSPTYYGQPNGTIITLMTMESSGLCITPVKMVTF